MFILLLGCTAGCRPKRLREVAQKEDDRTESQIRGERHLKKAQELFDQGDGVGAQTEFLVTLREDPGQYKAHLGLGDVYELEGDLASAIAEFVAHTELAPKPRHYLDRMFVYVFSKFSRTPSGPHEVTDELRAKALALLSRAVAAHRRGKHDVALSLLEQVRDRLPRTGVVEYFEGVIHLRNGQNERALEAFGHSIEHNPYFARRLLTDHEDNNLPGLMEKLRDVLARGLAEHPPDTETAFLLAVVHFRMGDHEAVVKATRNALAWGEARWDVLLVKAAAHARLGQKIPMEQAFEDLKAVQPNVSAIFTGYEPSIFQGMLADSITKLAEEKFAPTLKQPARSYFLWRLHAERKDPSAQGHRDTFFRILEKEFTPGEFENLPSTEPPSRQPANLGEFMGAVQERITAGMDALGKCDESRRAKRGQPSGRVILRVDLGRDGSVVQVVLKENTTRDPWLAYCMVRKLIVMKFPKPLRVTESFELPILVGPEVDGLGKEAAGDKKPGS